jgi:hypothetical protein
MVVSPEVSRWFRKATTAKQQVENAKTPDDLRDSWEDFLVAFSNAIGKLIFLSAQSEISRPFGHRLKNMSAKNDEGLVFLREARNTDVHGLEPSADYESGLTIIFGAFTLGPNVTEAQFNNNFANGVNTGNFTISTDEHGKISKLVTDNPILASFKPASIKLKDIYSNDKGKKFKVPNSLAGSSLGHL